jgi:hypothetical protein
MKNKLIILLFILLISGCRDKLDDPVGLDEVPKDIPQPEFVGGILSDSLSNFHYHGNTGSGERLWLGYTESIESRVLVRFEVSDSVVIADADSATVTFSIYGDATGDISFDVYPLISRWDEESVGWEESSTDTPWNNPGGDFDNTKIAHVVINDDEESFTFDCSEFSLIDTSFEQNKGMIFIYELGDTLHSIYSSESSSNQVKMTVYFGDSSKNYLPSSDAFIVNSTYSPGSEEVFIGEGYAQRALFYFNIDTVPSNVTVNRAYLQFAYKPEKSFFDSMTIYIFEVTGEWEGEETEFYSVPSANFEVYVEDTISSEIDITSLVQYWVNDGDNRGILMRAQNESNFCSRLVFDVMDKPELSIYYTPPPGED